MEFPADVVAVPAEVEPEDVAPEAVAADEDEVEDGVEAALVDAVSPVIVAAKALVAASEENVSINYDAAMARLKAALEPFED